MSRLIQVITDMNPEGEIAVSESVSKMVALIERLNKDDSGKFFNYLGHVMPW